MEYKSYLKEKLSKERYIHSLGVQKAAEELAERFGEDVAKASFAGLVHDIAKEPDRSGIVQKAIAYGVDPDEVQQASPGLIHGPLGAAMLKKDFGVTDEDILSAVKYHTTGKANMSKLEKIIYLADMIEENRDFDGIIILREYAKQDIDKALFFSLKHSILHLLSREVLMHKDTVEAYNYLLLRRTDFEQKI